jgi:hypothetical protein
MNWNRERKMDGHLERHQGGQGFQSLPEVIYQPNHISSSF